MLSWHGKVKDSLCESNPTMKAKGRFCLPFSEVILTILKNKVSQSILVHFDEHKSVRMQP